MQTITFYFDFVSPFARLALAQLPQALEGVSYRLECRPVLLGAVLQAHNNPGPIAVPAKTAWMRRHTAWMAHQAGIALDWPPAFPFNSLPLSRLALECSRDGSINRFVASTVFDHAWQRHPAPSVQCETPPPLSDPLAPEALAQLRESLKAQLRSSPDQAKAWLRSNTDAALAQGVFGVPSFVANGQCFWGLDSLPMLRACLLGEAWFVPDHDQSASDGNSAQNSATP